jgi:hypothetical protein
MVETEFISFHRKLPIHRRAMDTKIQNILNIALPNTIPNPHHLPFWLEKQSRPFREIVWGDLGVNG